MSYEIETKELETVRIAYMRYKGDFKNYIMQAAVTLGQYEEEGKNAGY